MIIKKTLLAGLLGCTMLAGCNGDDNKNNDAAGTFAPTNNPDPVLAVKPTLPKEDGPAPADPEKLLPAEDLTQYVDQFAGTEDGVLDMPDGSPSPRARADRCFRALPLLSVWFTGRLTIGCNGTTAPMTGPPATTGKTPARSAGSRVSASPT